MHLFKPGDLAITQNLRAPVNNGHLVTVVEVVGRDEDWDLEFAYLVERVDGERFQHCLSMLSPLPTPCSQQVLVDHYQLRPIGTAPRPGTVPAEEESFA